MIASYSNIDSNSIVKSICDGVGCNKEATQIIVEKVGAMGTITLRLCGECIDNFYANSIHRLTETKKRVLKQQVVRPACSNTSSQNQPTQQHRVPLDD